MAGDAPPDLRADQDTAGGSDDPVVRCAHCGAAVTHPQHAIAHAGAHRHTFTNPHGYVFGVRCFAEAPGCVLVGEATRAHTWFAGLAWRLGGCRTCGVHLGWGFSDGQGRVVLFGLIADHLA